MSLKFHDICGPCHESCRHCGIEGNANSCRSCADSNAGLPPHSSIDACACKAGFLPKLSPTPLDVCVNCIETDVQCMTQEQAEFINHAAETYSLPCLIESTDHRICYFNALSTSGCSPDPIEEVAGHITDENTGTTRPTSAQCYELLKAQWPFIIYWFRTLFPAFVGPADASDAELMAIRSILFLWIQHFGPNEIAQWTDIKTAVNGEAVGWGNYIAWIGASPGFSLDSGDTELAFPSDLQSWLVSSCHEVTSTCKELAIFNLKSTVCDKTLCSSRLRELCFEVNPSSSCASS